VNSASVSLAWMLSIVQKSCIPKWNCAATPEIVSTDAARTTIAGQDVLRCDFNPAEVRNGSGGEVERRPALRPLWIKKADTERDRVPTSSLELARPLRALNLRCLKLLHDDLGQIAQLF